MRYAYLGPAGTFSEEALRTLPAARDADLVPARSVGEALEAVRAGRADGAVVPLENSVGGSVAVTLDELATGSPLVITAEIQLRVEFVLAGAERPATVAAHPQASTQCRRWLRKRLPDATVVDVLSNAAAAEQVAAGAYDAAVTSPVAAARLGLPVRATGIADRPAVTRFALVSRPVGPPPRTGDDVTTIAVSIAHDRVGALLAVLTELAVRGVNLSRIESRPTGEALGRYAFFLDCTGHVAEARMGEALMGLRRVCADVRYLGSYPRAGGGAPVAAPAGTADTDFAAAAEWLTELRRTGRA